MSPQIPVHLSHRRSRRPKPTLKELKKVRERERGEEFRVELPGRALPAVNHTSTSCRVRSIAERLIGRPAAPAQRDSIPNFVGFAIGGNHRNAPSHPNRPADLLGRVLD